SYKPTGWPTVIPRIFVDRPDALIVFIQAVFGATLRPRDDERAPAELAIGEAIIMVGSTAARHTTTAFLYVYVPDAEAAYERALAAGARSVESPLRTPYGDLRAMIEDAFGNTWQIATRLN